MIYRLVLAVFFVSGALGLGYQVLWSKFLLDFIGVSAYSYATVLSAFMAGLALGSALLGRYADQSRSPLKLYAILELGVGIYAILYLPLTDFVASVYAGWVDYGPDRAGGDVGLWAKVVVSGLLLIPPTFLLGGTFPAMVRHATHHLGIVGRRASELYALNAFGAVVGTLVMAFAVIPGLGMHASRIVLAVGNGIVAVLAWLLASASKKPEEQADPAAAVGDDLPPAPVTDAAPEASGPVATGPAVTGPAATGPAATGLASSFVMRMALIFVAIEGAISFMYEIAWTRYFGVVLGSSTYSFAVMLAAFITGISLGSAILSRIEKRIGNPLTFFGKSQMVVGVLVLLPLPLYVFIPGLFLSFARQFSTDPSSFYLYELGKLVFCYLFMLPPTVLIGMAIPLLIKGLASTIGNLGEETGRIYAWNTLGSVFGSLAAGLILLPMLGMERLLAVAALGNLALGAAIVVTFERRELRRRAVAIAVPAFVVLLGFHLVTSGWNGAWFTLMRLTSGHERTRADIGTAEWTRAWVDSIDVELLEDDRAANLMVISSEEMGEKVYTLYVNGKPDASSKHDLPTQYLSGHIPTLLHPGPKDALVIGLASGITVGALLKYDYDRVDVVELLQEMPRATAYFDPWNERALEDSRCRVIVDDARSFMLYTEQEYDVIVAEPSNPWMVGTGALFSRDFYERARKRLRPGGNYLQWIQAYELSDDSIAAVFRSFQSVFPYVYAFQGNAVDVLLVGRMEPLEVNAGSIARRMEDPGVKAQLEKVNVRDVDSLLMLQRYSPHTVEYVASLTDQVNTDDNHLLEYRAPRDFFQGLAPVRTLQMDERVFASPALLRGSMVRGGVEPDRTHLLHVLDQGDIRIPAILTAFRAARLFEKDFDRGAVASDPAWQPALEMVDRNADQIAGEIDRFVAARDLDGLLATVNRYGLGLVIAASRDDALAARFLQRIEGWMGSGLDADTSAPLRRLRIDLLLASWKLDEAANVILEEATSQDTLGWDFLVRRACRIGDDDVFNRIVETLAKAQPDPVLDRLLESRRRLRVYD